MKDKIQNNIQQINQYLKQSFPAFFCEMKINAKLCQETDIKIQNVHTEMSQINEENIKHSINGLNNIKNKFEDCETLSQKAKEETNDLTQTICQFGKYLKQYTKDVQDCCKELSGEEKTIAKELGVSEEKFLEAKKAEARYCMTEMFVANKNNFALWQSTLANFAEQTRRLRNKNFSLQQAVIEKLLKDVVVNVGPYEASTLLLRNITASSQMVQQNLNIIQQNLKGFDEGVSVVNAIFKDMFDFQNNSHEAKHKDKKEVIEK